MPKTAPVIGTVGRILIVVCALTLPIATASTALSQVAAASAASKNSDRRITLSVSGGISLGSWQAGATWATVEFLRESALRPTGPEPGARAGYGRVVALSGASAGNINALLAATHSCASPMKVRPDSSIFWRVWIPIGWEQLVSSDTTGQGNGILSRSAFTGTWNTVQQEIAAYNARSVGVTSEVCRLPIGLTTTKVAPVSEAVSTNGRLRAMVQRTVGVFQLARRSDRSDSLVFAEPDSQLVVERSLGRSMMLPPAGTNPGHVFESFARRRRVSERDLFQLVLASSAFPVAFGPVQLVLYPRNCAEKPSQCVAEPPAFYADGGLFDNQAISAALALDNALWGKPLSERLKAAAKLADNNASSCKVDPNDVGVIAATDSVQAAVRRQLAILDSIFFEVGVRDSLSAVALRHAADSAEAERRSALSRIEANTRKQVSCNAAISGILSTINEPSGSTHAIFLDAGVLRGPMERWNNAKSSNVELPSTPLRSAFSLISNAINPATQYELAVLGRSISGSKDTTLTSTSRALPLLADGYAHFGAFLATAFRQHDFFVGVYDGISHAAEALVCVPRLTATSTCVDSTIVDYMSGGALNLGCDARLTLATLYRLESNDPAAFSPASERTGRCTVNGQSDAGLRDVNRGKILSSLARAAYKARVGRANDPLACKRKLRSPIDGPYCESNIESIMSHWASELKLEGLTPPTNCKLVAKSVVELATDSTDHQLCQLFVMPYRHYRSSVSTLMKRTQLAENRAVGLFVDIGSYIERSNSALMRTGFRLGSPAAVHEGSNRVGKEAIRFLPYSVDFVGRREVVVGLVPAGIAMARGSRRVLALDARVLTRLPRKSRTPDHGIQVLYGPNFRLVVPGPVLQSVEVSTLWGNGVRGSVPFTEASVSLLAGTVRSGVRWEAGRKGTMFIGAGDVSNMVASTLRAAFGDRK